MTTTPQTPFERLRAVLLPRERLAVALSGGLDSSVLLAAAVRILGADHCLALTARTPYVMEEEVRDSTALCRRLGVRQEKLAFPILPALANNPPLRCYLCKHALFSSLAARAAEMGFPLLADGSNLDDLDDYRPGRKALQELESLSGSCHGLGGYPPAGLSAGPPGISLRQTGLCVSADPPGTQPPRNGSSAETRGRSGIFSENPGAERLPCPCSRRQPGPH